MASAIPRLTRGEADFDRQVAGLVFNALPLDRTPDAVARPRTEEEVVAVVREAHAAGGQISVLSGGHNWIAAPVHEGGVLIDMGAFDTIEIDAEARTALVGTAAPTGVVAETIAAAGFAFPTGHCGLPGIGGFLLGGGFGLNVGSWKPSCFSVRSVRAVTAAGELVVASESENPELLWMARGAGPALPAVVTALELELQDRPAATCISSWVFDLDAIGTVTDWVNRVVPELPSNVEVAVVALGPERPDHLPSDGFPDHIVTVEGMVFAGSPDEARAAVAPLEAGAAIPHLAHADLEPVAYEEIHKGFDAMCHDGDRYLADTFWTDVDLGSLASLEEAIRSAPSGKSVVMAEMLAGGGKFGFAPEDAAYSIDGRTLVMAYAIWDDPAADVANRAWHAEVRELVEPISMGHFVNEADLHAAPGRLARCFSEANWDRLVELRRKWDPDGVFHDPPGLP